MLRKEYLSVVFLEKISIYQWFHYYSWNKKILVTPCYLCQLRSWSVVRTCIAWNGHDGPGINSWHQNTWHANAWGGKEQQPTSFSFVSGEDCTGSDSFSVCVQFCCELWRGKNDWIRPVHSLWVWARPIWFFLELGLDRDGSQACFPPLWSLFFILLI